MISGKLYVFAGGAGSGTDTVQAFDPSTGKGSVVGHLPVALSDLAAAQVGATTYLIGGYDGARPRSGDLRDDGRNDVHGRRPPAGGFAIPGRDRRSAEGS